VCAEAGGPILHCSCFSAAIPGGGDPVQTSHWLHATSLLVVCVSMYSSLYASDEAGARRLRRPSHDKSPLLWRSSGQTASARNGAAAHPGPPSLREVALPATWAQEQIPYFNPSQKTPPLVPQQETKSWQIKTQRSQGPLSISLCAEAQPASTPAEGFTHPGSLLCILALDGLAMSVACVADVAW
jgi:hypothetical protein